MHRLNSTLFPMSIPQLLRLRLDAGRASGERGYILDGFPRTRMQASPLKQAPVSSPLTLHLDVLLSCLLILNQTNSLQAEKLAGAQKLQVAFNLGLREEVLIEKCLGG